MGFESNGHTEDQGASTGDKGDQLRFLLEQQSAVKFPRNVVENLTKATAMIKTATMK